MKGLLSLTLLLGLVAGCPRKDEPAPTKRQLPSVRLGRDDSSPKSRPAEDPDKTGKITVVIAPPSRFFRSGGDAHHIVYLIDRSGSMVESFDAVRNEMKISIARLRAEHDLHIILFAKGVPQEGGSRALVPATPKNKEAAATFLDSIRAAGQTDPLPALKRAFEVLAKADPTKPGKLIYLLTDGNFPDNAAVLALVRKLNKDKGVQINTYLYGNRPPEAVKLMTQIAEENSGRYKFVSTDE